MDTTGNFWLFGGGLYRNDLWKYDITLNEWAWMSGDTILNASGEHGVKGVPGALNIPGARRESCSGWTDSLNNLWLFGGLGYDDSSHLGYLNDLMKFNISTGEWTWMSGSAYRNQANNYGVKGIANSTNIPGARSSYTKWKDLQENFWVWGGASSIDRYNDGWQYNALTNQWTWVTGTNLPNDLGLYQSSCTFDSVSLPMSRSEQRAAVVDNCGKFWIFGGYHINNGGFLNDLWIFDPIQNEWNWVSGTNVFNQTENYGILGISSVSNTPPSRCGAVAWWSNDNRLFMFGGGTSSDVFGDLWVYTPDSICSQICNLIFPNAIFQALNNSLCPGTCTHFLNLSAYAYSYQWYFPGASPDTSTAVNPTNICYANPGSYDVQLIASNANGSDTLLLSNYITVYPTPPPQSITQSSDTLFAIAGASSYQWYYNTTLITGATDY